MNINFEQFPDNVYLSEGLGYYARARGLAFGIMSGWLDPQVLDQMVSMRMIADRAEVYQVACVVCDTAMRRPFTIEEIDTSNKKGLGLLDFERICHEGFNSEEPCSHFDQYVAFMDTLAAGSDYAKQLDDQIRIYARLLDTTHDRQV